jgi:cell shape-determining protein MreC
MTYLSDKGNKKKSYIRYGVFLALFILFIIMWPYSKKIIYGSIEPVAIGYGESKNSFSFLPDFFVTYITSRRSLVAREKKLELEIEHLENVVAEKDALLREIVIPDASSTEEKKEVRPLILYPLMHDITKIYSTILLSKGFKDGVTVGSTVYIRGNQAVCTIKESYNSTSLCTLLTASGVATEGVTSSSSIVLSLVGRGGHFIADVARDAPVSVGEIIYVRSNPRMVLGTIREIANNNQDTSWHVFVEGAYNPVRTSVFYVQP